MTKNMHIGGQLQKANDMVATRDWRKFVTFKMRDPRYRAHIPPTTQAMAALPDTKMPIHLVVDMTKLRDEDYHT